MPSLRNAIEAAELEARANRLYRLGDYESAYAAHRLAAYLFGLERQYSRAVGNLVAAVSDLRPIRWGDFQVDTLREIAAICQSQSVGAIQRWLAIDRMSLVLFDYGKWMDAVSVGETANRFKDQIETDHRDPNAFEFDKANAFRRQAMIKSCGGRLSRGETTQQMQDTLSSTASDFESEVMYDSFATNLDVAGKIAAEIEGNLKKGHQYSQRALELLSKISHKWVVQEILWREVEFFHSKKDHKKVLKYARMAVRGHKDFPLVLEPRATNTSRPVIPDLRATLKKLGIDQILAEEGLVISPSRYKKDLKLAKTTIGRFVNMMLP